LVTNGKVLSQTEIENDVMNRIVREQSVRLKTINKISTGLKIRRIIMKNPIVKLAVAAAVVVAALTGMHFIGNPVGATVTFAQVIQPILNARTVVFDLVMGKDETGPVIHDIVAGSRIRRTFSNMDAVHIIDLDNAKILTLDPKSKGAFYMDIKGPIQEGTKNLLELVRNIVNKLEENPNIPVQELGQKEIDGREAIGFHASSPNEEVTIWADPQTAKPIRIELLLGQSLYILKNIEFDVPVDESLVSMEPPAGYTLPSMEYSMNQFTEQDFIESLRIWAEYLLDGRFPEALSAEDYFKTISLLVEKLPQSKLSKEEGTRIGMTFGRGLIFFQNLGADWHYAGGGVKLGDAETVVFWYRPKDSQTYRVIYGDLSVKDVASENLPK
jgi:hypothetical protein